MASSAEKIVATEGDHTLEPFPVENHLMTSITQKYLLVLLFIQWVICLLIISGALYESAGDNSATISSVITSIWWAIALAIYYICGILFAYQLHRLGLLIFGWIGVVLYVIFCFFVSYLILVVLALGTAFGNADQSYIIVAVLGSILIGVSVIIIITLRLTFHLAKLIKGKECSGV